LLKQIYHIIATLGFTGYIPYAPGTFGTAVGLLLIILLRPDDQALLMFTIPIIIVGTVSAHHAEKSLGKDSGHIVIDEFCGYMLSIMFIPKSTGYLVLAFVLFRLFDILKPPPVDLMEKSLRGGAGVMFDDLMAGIYANICLQLWRVLTGS
jgi:phosphatidylglycerophosphatase A